MLISDLHEFIDRAFTAHGETEVLIHIDLKAARAISHRRLKDCPLVFDLTPIEAPSTFFSKPVIFLTLTEEVTTKATEE